MSFLDKALEPPSYGFLREGVFYKPSYPEMFREFGNRINVFADRRNWLNLFGWASTLSMLPFFILFWVQYFTLPNLLIGFVYSMVLMGTHGTIYYHRYGTHRAYQYAHPFWLFLVRNMVVKLVPEETYIVSHHVHHAKSEQPGDPYNVNGGWWYCFLADAIHQPISKTLSPEDYKRATAMIAHTGVKLNSYEQYQRWGSICHPFRTVMHYALNWGFWYGFFYLIGGTPLAVTIFAWSGVWGIGVRTFNYDGHGAGKDKRREGIDFNREDLSINQKWPGLVTGEWHNNHHLYPNGARAGFLPYQLDYAWWFIKVGHKLGAISSYRDYTQDFFEKHFLPYQEQKRQAAAALLATP